MKRLGKPKIDPHHRGKKYSSFFSSFSLSLCFFLRQRMKIAEKMHEAAEALQDDEEVDGVVTLTHVNACRPSPNPANNVLPVSLIHTSYGVTERKLKFETELLFDARFGKVVGNTITFLEIVPTEVVEEPLLFLPQAQQVIGQVSVDKGLIRGGKVRGAR